MKKGTPVVVLFEGKQFDGVFDGYENIDVTEDDGSISFTLKRNPRLKLADGRTLFGFECWWGSKTAFEEMPLK